MIDLNHGLSLTQQAKSLGFSRSSVYYLPHPISEHDQTLMKRIESLREFRRLGCLSQATMADSSSCR